MAGLCWAIMDSAALLGAAYDQRDAHINIAKSTVFRQLIC